jgi:membrane protease YdiL (CAAX protease family)
MATKPDKKKESAKPSAPRGSGNYFKRTLDPLPCLFFLLPLLVVYEIGTIVYATNLMTGEVQTIKARSILQSMFGLMGVTGYSLPVYFVVGILLLWHLLRRDRFAFEPMLYVKMGLESAAWALPLAALMMMVVRVTLPQAAGVPEGVTLQAMLVFSVGAGIYEELLFRLMGLSLVRLAAQKLLGFKPENANYIAIAVTSVAFALYHYSSPETFTLSAALQYTLAGVFFSGVYAYRGFGIVVGAHAMYDVLVTFIYWQTGMFNTN